MEYGIYLPEVELESDGGWEGGGGGGVGEGGDKIMSPWKVVECTQKPEMTPCNKSY